MFKKREELAFSHEHPPHRVDLTLFPATLETIWPRTLPTAQQVGFSLIRKDFLWWN